MNRTMYPLTLFYDAACSVCALEMDHLRERDRSHRLRFIDISAAGFDPSPWGVSARALDAEIHGLCADGTMLRGVEVLRLAYAAAGLGWVLQPTGWAPLKPLFDLGYRVFARHRREVSRAAAPLVAHLRARRARQMAERMRRCSGAACDRSAS